MKLPIWQALTLFIGAGLALTSCGEDSGPSSSPNQSDSFDISSYDTNSDGVISGSELTALTGDSSKSSSEESSSTVSSKEEVYYVVTFVDWDDTVLYKGHLKYGQMPKYPYENPTRESTPEYDYKFAGWDPRISYIREDTTYRATYTEIAREYNVTFLNYNGDTLESYKLRYGYVPAFHMATPTHPSDDQFDYTFSGWDKPLEEVTEDVTYTAQYSTVVREYTVSFVNYDGTVLYEATLPYGATPIYDGETPTRDPDEQFTYSFLDWDREISMVTGDATYTALYSEDVRYYEIVFLNYDGAVLSTQHLPYGASPTTPSVPEKPADVAVEYVFIGWDKAISSVTADATYTAVFGEQPRVYTATFLDSLGNVIYTAEYEYGETPAYNGQTPQKQMDAEFEYQFEGWDKAFEPISSDVVYSPVYKNIKRHYTVEFRHEDGKVLQTLDCEYGEIPSYTGDKPYKVGDAQYSYEFEGWDKAIEPVSGNTVYNAVFKSSVNCYDIVFLNDDGTLLWSSSFPYGSTPVYGGANPTKPSIEGHDYQFYGWDSTLLPVTQSAVYTAQYVDLTWKCTVTFINEDINLGDYEFLYGETPVYAGDPLTKQADDQYTYSFIGWSNGDGNVYKDGNLPTVTGDVTYRAVYDATLRKYKITFYDANYNVIQEGLYEYGATPSFNGKTPTKDPDNYFVYTFTGFGDILPVTGDHSYYAYFKSEQRLFTVNFYSEDGQTLLYTQKLGYGAWPSYQGEVPEKASTAQYDYVFAGFGEWAITDDVDYFASFDAYIRSYDIFFYDGNGTILWSTTIGYGSQISYLGAEPTKEMTVDKFFTFNTWDHELGVVTGEESFYPVFYEHTRYYKVTFVDENGVSLYSNTFPYGSTPIYEGNLPIKPSDEGHDYAFDHWGENGLQPVTGEATYMAVFTTTDKLFTITFYDANGNIISQKSDYHYGDAIIFPTEAPSKERDDYNEYTFGGWTSTATIVTGNNSIYPNFYATPRLYTVTFLDRDGVTVLQTGQYQYGAVVNCPGSDPSDYYDENFHYYFANWNGGNTIYATGDISIFPTFTKVNYYTVSFYNYDDTLLGSVLVDETNTAVYGGPAPTKPDYEKYTYDFYGWLTPGGNPAPMDNITENKSFYAGYTEQIKMVSVRFVDGDGKELHTISIEWGDDASYESSKTPTKTCTDEGYRYKWNGGWDKSLTSIKEDVVVTATFDKVATTYTVVWLYYNQDELARMSDLASPDASLYTDDVATFNYNAQYKWVFSGDWNVLRTEDDGYVVYYIAGYTQQIRTYTLYFYADADKTILLGTYEVAYGTSKNGYEYDLIHNTDIYQNAASAKPSTAQYDYIFQNRWDKELGTIYGDDYFYAYYAESLRYYTVKFYANEGDAIPLDTCSFAYGEIPSYNWSDPVKEDSDGYSYSFDGWIGGLKPVTGDANYYVNWKATRIMVKITFYDWDYTIIAEGEYAYGDALLAPADPSRPMDAVYVYTFRDWGTALPATATEDASYYAQYNAEYRLYTVRFFDKDGNLIEGATKQLIYYGTITFEGDLPIPSPTEYYTYSFAGWRDPDGYLHDDNQNLGYITSDCDYQLVVNAEDRTYVVTFLYYDGSERATFFNAHYGDVLDPGTVGRPGDETYYYVFDKWVDQDGNPFISVVGDMTYSPTFTQHYREYEFVYYYKVNGDWVVMDTRYFHYGEQVTFPSDPLDDETTYYLDQYKWNPVAADYTVNGNSESTKIYVFGLRYLEYRYDAVAQGYYITQCNQNSGTVTIPEAFDDGTNGLHDIIGIDTNAFNNCEATIAALPAKLQSIGDYAFSYCPGLSISSLPSSLTSIGAGAFQGCTGITSLTIDNPDCLIGTEAFRGCTGLVSLNIVAVNTLGTYAFRGCRELASATLTSVATVEGSIFYSCDKLVTLTICGNLVSGNSSVSSLLSCGAAKTITVIGATSMTEDAFSYLSKLQTITFDTALDSIPARAFEGCTGLVSITVPSVTSIGECAFWNCSSLTNVNIDLSGLTSIGNRAFEECSELVNLTIGSYANGNSLKSIGSQAFHYCLKLSTLILTSSLETIGAGAFNNCQSIDNLSFLANLKSIGDDAFIGCLNLKNITIHTSAISDCTGIGQAIPSIVETINIIGDGSIPAYFAYQRTSLTAVNLNGAITSIGDKAFEGCTSLTYFDLDGVITIESCAFRNCANLANLDFSDVQVIRSEAFYGCAKLTTLDLSSIINLDDMAFYGCTEVESLTLSSVIENIGRYNFADMTKLSGSLTLPESLTFIGDGAFFGCENITAVTLPSSITNMGSSVFYGCKGIVEIVSYINASSELAVGSNLFSGLDDLEVVKIYGTYMFDEVIVDSHNNFVASMKELYVNVAAISIGLVNLFPYLETIHFLGEGALPTHAASGLTSLTSVSFSDKITSIGNYAFYNDSALPSIFFYSAVTSIGEHAFEGCTALSTVTFNGPLSAIGAAAFASSGITYFGAEVASIDNYAFQDCLSLERVDITGTVTDMRTGTFKGCTNLKVVNLPAGLVCFGDDFFYDCTSLTSLVVPSSLKNVGSQVFYNCTSLKTLTLGLDQLLAFKSAGALTNITTYFINGDGVVPVNAFYQNATVTSITFNGLITGFGDYAFYKCSNLIDITSNQDTMEKRTITSLGEHAFDQCASLPNFGFKFDCDIPAYAFASCSALTYINTSATLAYVGDYAFYGDANLTFSLVAITDYVGADAFYNCAKLAALPSLSDGVVIGSYAFGGCSLITSLDLSFLPQSLSTCAFGGLTLTDVRIPASYFDALDYSGNEYRFSKLFGTSTIVNLTFIGDGGNLPDKLGISSVSGIITIESGITAIGSEAFLSGTDIYLPVTIATIGNDFVYYSLDALVHAPSEILLEQGNTNLGCARRIAITCTSEAFIPAEFFKDRDNLREITLGSGITAIGDGAFSGCYGLSSIALPSTLVTIGANAFRTNISLTDVALPSSLRAIGEYAFYDCRNLSSVVLPSGIETIGQRAYYECHNLLYIYLPTSLTSLGTQAIDDSNRYGTPILVEASQATAIDLSAYPNNPIVYDVTSYGVLDDTYTYAVRANQTVTIARGVYGIVDIVIPSTVSNLPVTAIAAYAFYDRYTATSLSMPATITSIGNGAFSECVGLEGALALPRDLAYLGSYSFSRTKISSLSFNGNGVTTISNSAFSGCSRLESISWPSNLLAIEDSAFAFCPRLEQLTLPSTLASIGSQSFRDDTSLTSITILCDELTLSGNSSFLGCSSLSTLVLNGGNLVYGFHTLTSLTTIVVDARITTLTSNKTFSACYPYMTNLTVHGAYGNDLIGANAFKDCSKLESVTISGIAELGDSAFRNCDSLVTFTKDSMGLNLGAYCFYDCDSLASFDFSTVCNWVPSFGFFGCDSLDNVVLSDNIYIIGEQAFSYCTSLTSITMTDYITQVRVRAFAGSTSLSTIVWSNSLHSLPSFAFDGCIGLQTVVLPSCMETIGEDAFRNCSGLTSITLNEGLKTIANRAFQNSGLTSISFPTTITSIGTDAFDGCTGMNGKTVTIRMNLVASVNGSKLFNYAKNVIVTGDGQLPSMAFANTPVISVTFTGNPTYFEYQSFYNCTALTTLTFTDGHTPTTIGSYAFYGCTGLTNLDWLSATLYIYDYAFVGASNLTSVDLTSAVTVGREAFSYNGEEPNNTVFTFGTALQGVGIGAFYGRAGITSLNAPNIVSILREAFYGTSIATLTLGDSLTTLGENAFHGCPITTFHIPAGFVSIDNPSYPSVSPFAGCTQVTSITIPSQYHGVYSIATLFPDSIDTIAEVIYVVTGDVTEVVFNRLGALNDGLTVTISEGVTSISGDGLVGTDWLVSLPSTLKSIGSQVFSYWTGANTITLPEGLESIGYSAFAHSSITSIVLPASLTYLGENAFYQAYDLTTVSFAAGSLLTTISDYCFAYSGITSFEFPSSVNRVNQYAFFNCPSLRAIVLPNSITYVGYLAFGGSYMNTMTMSAVLLENNLALDDYKKPYKLGDFTGMLRTLTLTELQYLTSTSFANSHSIVSTLILNGTLENLPESIFSGLSDLESVTLPSGLLSIGALAFYGTSLQSCLIPSTVTSIGNGAFQYCGSLASVTMPTTATLGNYAFASSGLQTIDLSGVTSIGEHAFDGCSYLASLTIPSSLTSIPGYAFYDCDSLQSLVLPSTLTGGIGDYAFANCDNLASVTIGAGLIGEDTYLANIFHSGLAITSLWGENNSITEMTIQGTSIGSYKALLGFTALRKVTFEEGLVELPDRYLRLGSLREVVLPQSLRVIGNECFYHSVNLTNCTSMDGHLDLRGVTTIGYGAFEGCTSLTSVTMNAVASVPNRCFYGCSSLEQITATTATAFGQHALAGTTALTAMSFNAGTTLADSCFYESGLVSVDLTGVTSISNYTFSHCTSLANVTWGTTLETIGIGGFHTCTSLESIDFTGSAISTISNYAFQNCTSLETIVISSGLGVWQYAFKDCTGVRSFDLSASGLTYLNADWFADMANLGEFVIPDSVVTLPVRLFNGLTGLRSLTIGSGVTSIPQDFCKDCTALTSIIIGSNVETIDDSFCTGCTSLQSISIPDSVRSIGGLFMDGCTNLTTLHIGSGLSYMTGTYPIEFKGFPDNYPFRGCEKLAYITVSDGNQLLKAVDNVIYSKDGTKLFFCPLTATSAGTFVVPNDVIEIYDYAFAYHVNLTSINLGNIQIIGRHAFEGCIGLTSVNLSNATSIDGAAFMGCSNLADVVSLAKVISLRDYAFKGCALTSVVLQYPYSVLDATVFADCESLATIYLIATEEQASSARVIYPNIHILNFSETEPSSAPNTYWHYVEGVPTPWAPAA